MRGLKFRAWDLEAKCYIKDPILVDNFGQVYVVCEEASNIKGTCLITHKPNVVLEQYTGLKDVNGNEIAEGDILEDGAGEPFEYWEVKFRDGKFVGETQGVTEDLFELTDLEIIGTVQEYSESWKKFNVEV